MLRIPVISKGSRPFSIIAAAITLGLAVQIPLPLNSTTKASQQKPISVTSELVVLPVSVTDSQGTFVSGLGRDNFRVYEDNQPRDITLFEQEDAPVSVGLLVDHSSSMASKLPNIVAAVAGFTHSSNPKDEMFVVNFGDNAMIGKLAGKAFASDKTEIEKAVSTSASGRTALYDAVAVGLDHLQLAHWQKRALILVSDGGDNASAHKYREILAKARQSDVTIYALGLVDEFGEEENPGILKQLCRDTGGTVSFPRSGPAVVEAATHIAQDLREQYLLGFVPRMETGGKSFRKIHVNVTGTRGGKLRVRTRPGYSVAPTAAAD